LPGKKSTERDAPQNDKARSDDAEAPATADQHEDQRQREIELILDRERPGVGECRALPQADVLHRDEELPERRDLRELAQRWQAEVDGEHRQIGGEDSQGAAEVEAPEVDARAARERREQLTADEIAAEDEEEIDAHPTVPMDLIGKREAEAARVIDDDDDDRECPEQVETGLAPAPGEARIEVGFGQGITSQPTRRVRPLRPPARDRPRLCLQAAAGRTGRL
jgi:hypothetical protein